MKILVGFTGFVGSNLAAKANFDGLYNSKNISQVYGTNPDLLIYAGVRAAKFLANKDEAADWKQVSTAIDNIRKINPKKLVLISTIDVYSSPVDVDEDSCIDENMLQPYGKNRYKLENWVRDNVSDYLIVRLPGLYGKNIKKNFIYDLITVIPSMLNERLYKKLSSESSLISNSYLLQDNGFYKCRACDTNLSKILKNEFLKLGFTALNFTDSRGVYQFYNLANLWHHIEIALKENITLLNLATEPVQVSEIYKYIYGKEFLNELDGKIANYNYKTKYDDLFNGKNGYIFDKEYVLNDIKRFVEARI